MIMPARRKSRRNQHTQIHIDECQNSEAATNPCVRRFIIAGGRKETNQHSPISRDAAGHMQALEAREQVDSQLPSCRW